MYTLLTFPFTYIKKTQTSSVNAEISPKSVRVKIVCSSAYKINRLPLLINTSGTLNFLYN